ncbi:sigma-54-dependent Fis family transcriptional regulator [bacterium]|nr:sigma-54-dependent Fis family transcriptional regulator [bacterium]
MKVFIVDDEDSLRKILKIILCREGYEVSEFDSPINALEALKKNVPEVIISDFKMPQMNGDEFIDEAKKLYPEIFFVIMTAFATVKGAVSMMKKGAYDYLMKPFSEDEVLSVLKHIKQIQELKNENKRLKSELNIKYSVCNMIGKSDEMNRLYNLIEKVSRIKSTVLITGESGSGKELVARGIHHISDRKNKHFLAVNCAAISGEILESELFGYKKGAFTGAISNKKGYFESTDGGTLFLDEIGEMDFNLQSKLLRVLETGELLRVGDSIPIKVDVRVIAATNKILLDEIDKGSFRKDLYYRLEVVKLLLPPLRERAGDIVMLADHFLNLHGRTSECMDAKFVEGLMNYSWPGNIRELKNVIESVCIFAEADKLEFNDLPEKIKKVIVSDSPQPFAESDRVVNYDVSFKEFKKNIVDTAEINYLNAVLNRSGGNVSKAAEMASVERRNFQKLLKKHDIK